MRKTELLMDGWAFSKDLESWQTVNLPHTWNSIDGTDGKNDYYRGTCYYARYLNRPALHSGEQLWLEITGAAMTASVCVNGEKLCTHEGGYSTFRVNLTDALTKEENQLSISVDNSKNDRVYPQKADFTFYGGLYRQVKLITVPAAHFALGCCGGNGVRITPILRGSNAEVAVETYVEGPGKTVSITVNGETQVVPVQGGRASAAFTIANAHLWNGIEDPYLYTCLCELDSGDTVKTQFGCRSIGFDPEKGFLLNGKPYRLCGAARHQDREGLGSALTAREHEEDIAMMLEMGANTVRLAHYQHDQYFYDLCDEKGLIVWAEIPYITEHLPNARQNSLSQMRELVIQNYNHPSIVCWGLSNEITATGGVNEDMVENHKLLNDLCHRLDPTRPTTMAHAFMLDGNDPFVMLPDIRSYNLYYGWYIGELVQNDEWFDAFHAAHPEAVIGLSEYGADANPAYQSAKPEKGDWSESYQAVYHEHMLKMWQERPYIWAMHCWNMFDFGADGRNEGGKPGQNQKGLVTFDRKTRKDAFYIYKAYLSKEPFVHLCGSRYVNSHESETEIKVYSNQSTVTLYMDGQKIGTQTADKIFRFQAAITGEHTFQAVSGACTDTMTIRHTEKADASYRLEGEEIVNWFDKPEAVMKEGFYSIMDSMEALKQNPRTAAILTKVMERARASYGDVAKNVKLPEAVQRQMDKMPLQKLFKQAGKSIPADMIAQINGLLNQIPRE